MLNEEKKFYSKDIKNIVGVDEAGRGPLAGPVFAAAVIFPQNYKNENINDSKKLSEKKREELFDEIIKNALAYGIASVDAPTIDKINIYEASKVAMKDAINQINIKYDLILTDAMPLKNMKTNVEPIIKGDAKALCIAAASILAKVSRDRYMNELEKLYPSFSFSKHKGYGTKKHIEEIKENGIIPGIHRKTFRPIKTKEFEQIKLF